MPQGDFSRNPFAYREELNVSRVLIEQGRVQLDSDANEQTESLLRFLRGLAFDLIGAHGGVDDAFEIVPDSDPKKKDPQIRWGVYYVDGIRCMNFPPDTDLWQLLSGAVSGVVPLQPYSSQRNYFPPDDGDLSRINSDEVLLYLDVFERHISATENETLREVALLGPDTASRAVVVWQVRAMPAKPFKDRLRTLDRAQLPATWDTPYVALNLLLRSGARMRARAVVTDTTDPCTISPDARYRGTENRLFRVEIHNQAEGKQPVTFKWSPDNASIAYPVRRIEGTTVHVDSLGRDDRTAIQINDWVEVVDDEVSLMAKAHPLLRVVDVRPSEMVVILSAQPEVKTDGGTDRHPILRRWASEPVPLREGKSDTDGWFELQDGVEVQFSHEKVPDGGYRTGDYWLIPTRTATGDVEWPRLKGQPASLPPHGVDHHYAPLAIWSPTTAKTADVYRRSFKVMSR
jgi:hypothetical protein